MQSMLTRRGIVALVAAGLLFSVAGAQDKPGKPKMTDRDPFVNPHYQLAPTNKTQPGRVDTLQNSNNQTVQDAKTGNVSEEPTELAAPDVKVTGIVASNGHKQAILQSSQGTRIVTVGEKLADYQVSAITNDSVTLSHSGRAFKVPMTSEF